MDIEEDIKKVNNLIERCKECKFAACEQCEISYTEVQAIEHILAEREKDKKKIEELEAKLEFKEYGDLDNLKFEEYMKEFIPKQKVIDKMEQLNKEIKNGDEIEAIFKIKQQQILQELLEDKQYDSNS